MFGNRLGKNLKQLKGWLKQSGVTCYRTYDADMPEYAFAIDSYRVIGEEARPALAALPRPSQRNRGCHVQEYAAPPTIDEEGVRRRRAEAFSVLPDVTGVPSERIRVRVRRKQTRGNQYQKVAEQFRFHIVEEGGLKFRVNFDDYLDTGLFLDHRPTRARLRELAKGKRFLNLFAYTSTATVYAAAGGARAEHLPWICLAPTWNGPRKTSASTTSTRATTSSCRRTCVKWLEDAARHRDVLRPDLPGPADVLELQAHGRRARHLARPP